MDAQQELAELLGRDTRSRSRRIFDHYIMGGATPRMYEEHELRAKLNWDDSETEKNQFRLDTIRGELDATGDILRDQFGKIAVLVALLGFIIGLGLSDRTDSSSIAIKVVCFAAIFAVWAQSPRLKVIFRFRKRKDAGLRAGSVTGQWEAFWYTYKWLISRENTTNAIELLVIIASLITMVALGFVFVAV